MAIGHHRQIKIKTNSSSNNRRPLVIQYLINYNSNKCSMVEVDRHQDHHHINNNSYLIRLNRHLNNSNNNIFTK